MDTEPGMNHGEAANERSVLLVLLLIASVYASLLLLTDFLPFVDLPFHLGVATVVRGYGDAGNQFSDYFTLQIAGQPNVFHLWFCSRTFFPSVEFANKVYFALYTFLLPLSLYALIREMRGNPWFSLLSFLYLYNFSTHWGFVGFVGAMPAVLYLFAVVLRHLRAPTNATRLAIALGSSGLFFVHVLAALFFLFAFWLACWMCQGADRWQALKSCAPALPLVAIISGWWLAMDHSGEQTLVDFLWSYYQTSFLPSLSLRSFVFIFDNAYLADGRLGLIWGAWIALVSVSFVLWSLAFEWRSLLGVLRAPRHRAVIAFVLAAACCFFLLPEGLPGQWALNQRFSVYIVLGIVALSSVLPLPHLSRRTVAGVILAGCLIHAALYADYFRAFGIETAGFSDEILPEAGTNRLAGLILEPHFRGALAYLHFSNYYIVRKQGIAVSRMVDFRFGTVRRKPEGGELPVALMRFDIDPDYTGQYDEIDYLVVRGEMTDDIRSSLFNFEEKVRNGEWSLLVRR